MPAAATNADIIDSASPALGRQRRRRSRSRFVTTLMKRRRTLVVAASLGAFAIANNMMMDVFATGPEGPRLLVMTFVVLLAGCFALRMGWARWVGIGLSGLIVATACFNTMLAIDTVQLGDTPFVWAVATLTYGLCLGAFLMFSRGLSREIRRAHRSTAS